QKEQPYNEVYQFLTALPYQFTTARDKHHRRVVELASPNGASSSTTERKRRTKK
ncbi:IS481 family transposase, partial [Burkholderia multivorans]